MNFRYEFAIILSGCGETAKEAWNEVLDSVSHDGLGNEPREVHTDAGWKRNLLKGRDVAMKMCLDDDDTPEGCLAAWDRRRIK